jgi:hypothetical protein
VRAGVTWLTTSAYGSLAWECGCVREWLGTLSAVGRCACHALVSASGATVSAQGL